jgi:hypothetical protein
VPILPIFSAWFTDGGKKATVTYCSTMWQNCDKKIRTDCKEIPQNATWFLKSRNLRQHVTSN